MDIVVPFTLCLNSRRFRRVAKLKSLQAAVSFANFESRSDRLSGESREV